MRHQIKADKKQFELTDKEYRFANYYLGQARFNATEAAKLAGYSERTARQQGSRLLTNVYIEKYIQKKSQSVLEKLGVTQERILAEFAKIAFANVTDLFEGDWKLKSQSDIPKGSLAAVKNLTKTEAGVKVEMHDKLGALLKLWDLVKDR
ncbi:MAG: terminase small subunit [Bacteroidota bacterium]